MENLKLISVRLDPNLLAVIDDLAAKHQYLTRSSVINGILRNVVLCSSPAILWKILTTYSPDTCGYTVDFRVDPKKLENLPHDE